MHRQIVISTGARLHCGPFAHPATSGRRFGGVGFMVSPPGFLLRATPSDADLVAGEDYWQERLQTVVARYRSRCPVDQQPPAARWEIVRAIPPHAGLGSGTQLGLAAATALALMAGEGEVPAPVLARRSARGLRSAVGLHGFVHGGLIVEGGKLSSDEISPLVARTELPRQWRFVLIRPRDGTGLCGEEEVEGFARLPPILPETTDRLCRLALLDLLPSAIERNFDQFAAALDEFSRIVGEVFAPLQGGIFSDPQMRQLADCLHNRGVRGLGQSSWGPTLFIARRDAESAQALVAELANEATCANCELTIAEPLNRGATIEVID